MLARTFAPALFGTEGQIVSIECDITNGLPGFIIVGLGDKAVEESRERVRSAIKNSGLMLPPRRLTLNLAPADLPKDGSGYDLGMAIAVLAASGQVDAAAAEDTLFLGELALDGSIRPVKGVLLAAQIMTRHKLRRIFVPSDNSSEAALLTDIKVFAVDNLLQLYRHLCGDRLLSVVATTTNISREPVPPSVDLSGIYGQLQAKRAVEIAAAGGHNIIMSGPPGTGKTLLAKSIMGLLPEPTLEEMIEITKLHNLVGRPSGIIHQRPFRAPHHTASSVALIGGGAIPRPGEISLSHGGVLFLDELPEFPRSVLEVLRQPLEEGSITVARAAGVVTFPARFMLVGTLNPCPCGYRGDPSGNCRCKESQVITYQRKLSGPLMDRIDIVVNLARLDNNAIISAQAGEPTDAVAGRVSQARNIQLDRLDQSDAFCNAHMSNEDVKKYCKIDNETQSIAAQAMAALGLSARGYTRILKVARTIADLANSKAIQNTHFTEAMQYRPVFTARDSS